MEFTAISKNVRVSPRKARQVADMVRGMPAKLALEKLSFLVKSASEPIAKAVKSALANGKNQDLKIKNILVDEGIKRKMRDTSHGARFGGGIIKKRMSHIKIVLTDG